MCKCSNNSECMFYFCLYYFIIQAIIVGSDFRVKLFNMASILKRLSDDSTHLRNNPRKLNTECECGQLIGICNFKTVLFLFQCTGILSVYNVKICLWDNKLTFSALLFELTI
jgi:hypothetical protein